MKKIWNYNGAKINSDVEKFCVGQDYACDNYLLPYDIQASKAHIKAILNMGIIDKRESGQLQKALDEILALHQKGKFIIKVEHEDCHTAIEEYLIKKLGDTGRKIHTARSRNDQVLVALRLFMLDWHDKLRQQHTALVKCFAQRSKKYQAVEMPGYTHMQKAMPTTVKEWLSGFKEALQDQQIGIKNVEKIFNQNPLGTASGFGVRNLNLDRKITTQELGFKGAQSPLYAGLSRGLFEYNFLHIFVPSLLVLSRFYADLLFFTADDKQYFQVANFLTTGSSIMPQKKNFDTAEVMRGKIKLFLGNLNTIAFLQTNMLSGYNRDIALIKPLFVDNTFLLQEIFSISHLIVTNIKPNIAALQDAMTDDLYATEQIYELVKKGVPFRTAYQQIKNQIFKDV